MATDLCLRPENGDTGSVARSARQEFAADLRSQMETAKHQSTKMALLTGIGKYRAAKLSAMKAVDGVVTVKREREREATRERSPPSRRRQRSRSPGRTLYDPRPSGQRSPVIMQRQLRTQSSDAPSALSLQVSPHVREGDGLIEKERFKQT